MKKMKVQTENNPDSQGDILDYLEKHPTWQTTLDIALGMKLQTGEKREKRINRTLTRKLKALENSNFIESKKTEGVNALQYKILQK